MVPSLQETHQQQAGSLVQPVQVDAIRSTQTGGELGTPTDNLAPEDNNQPIDFSKLQIRKIQ